MKRVLYIITQTHHGGAQKYVHDLALNLSKRKNFDVTVAVGEGRDQSWMNDLSDSNIPVLRLNHVKRNLSPVHDILSGFELLKLYRKTKPDIIHLNSSKIGATGAVTAWIYRLISRKANPKIIYTIHGLVLNDPSWSFIHKSYYRFAEWFGGLFKDSIIAVSEHDKQTAIKYAIAPKNKILVIHNGINTDQNQFLDRNGARSKLGLDDRFTIVTIAGIYKTKGIMYAIKSISILNEETRAKIHYVIIGDGPERHSLEDYVKRHNLANTITFLGAKDNARIYLKAFDLFVLSSIKEGLSYTLIEAVASGLPIIATDVGGNTEVIENKKTGIIVPPQNHVALADAITNLMQNESLRLSLAERAHKSMNRFSEKEMIDKTVSLYQEHR